MLAAIGVAEVGRTLAVLAARDPERPSIVGPAVTAVGGMLACMVMVGMHLRTLPFGDTKTDTSYSWFFLESAPDQPSFVRSWARWTYEGFAGQPAYAAYRPDVSPKAEIGE